VAGVANGQVVDLSATCHLGNAQAGCMDVVHADGFSTHFFGEHQAMATHLPFRKSKKNKSWKMKRLHSKSDWKRSEDGSSN